MHIQVTCMHWAHTLHRLHSSTNAGAGLAAGSMLVQAPAAQAIDAGYSFQPLVRAWSMIMVQCRPVVRKHLRSAASTFILVHAFMQAPIVSAVTAVLTEQQQALAQAQEPAPPLRTATSATPAEGHRRVFFDMLVDGEPSGRIVVELYDDVPVGAARFADLAQGKQGVGYRRTKFDAINEVRTWCTFSVQAGYMHAMALAP
jgi:hypothetical protein